MVAALSLALPTALLIRLLASARLSRQVSHRVIQRPSTDTPHSVHCFRARFAYRADCALNRARPQGGQRVDLPTWVTTDPHCVHDLMLTSSIPAIHRGALLPPDLARPLEPVVNAIGRRPSRLAARQALRIFWVQEDDLAAHLV